MVTIAFLITASGAAGTYFFRHEAWASVQATFGIILGRRLKPNELFYGTIALIPCALLGAAFYLLLGVPVMAASNFFSCATLFAYAVWISSQEERLNKLAEKPEWYNAEKPGGQFVHILNGWANWTEKKGYTRMTGALKLLASVYEKA